MKINSLLLLSFLFLTGCTLAGDIMPPESLATAQAAQPISQPTEPSSPTSTPQEGSTSVIISVSTERGRLLFSEKCAPCHGESGLGEGSQSSELPLPASPIGDPEFARSASPMEWFRVVTEGRIDRFMPGFFSLNDQERWDVVAYTLSLSSQPMDILLGGEIFAGMCADCHGVEGSGTGNAPDLTNFEWIAQQSLDQIISTIQRGISPGMPSFEDSLAEEEIMSVARFIYNLSFPGTSLHSAEEVSTTEQDELIATRISGKVTNGSEGGTVPVGLEVTLYGFDGQQPSLTDTTQASETGEYFFEDIEIQPGRVFVTAVEYQGTTYGSEVMLFADKYELDLPITIYDTSADLSRVQVDRLHLIFDMPVEGVLQVTELWILSNSGDRTIATDAGEGIFQITLPEGAANLGFESGTQSTRFVSTEGVSGFVDLLPIRPGAGSHEIVFSFNMTIDGSLDFTQILEYPVEAVVLLAPQGVVELQGEGIQDMGLRQMSGTSLKNYSAGPLSAGDELEITVKQEKSSPSAIGGTNNTIGIVVGISLFILALGFTGFWLDRRLQRREVAIDEVSIATEPVQMEAYHEELREQFLRELADLDDAYEAGDLEENQYKQKRKDVKSKLMEIL